MWSGSLGEFCQVQSWHTVRGKMLLPRQCPAYPYMYLLYKRLVGLRWAHLEQLMVSLSLKVADSQKCFPCLQFRLILPMHSGSWLFWRVMAGYLLRGDTSREVLLLPGLHRAPASFVEMPAELPVMGTCPRRHHSRPRFLCHFLTSWTHFKPKQLRQRCQFVISLPSFLTGCSKWAWGGSNTVAPRVCSLLCTSICPAVLVQSLGGPLGSHFWTIWLCDGGKLVLLASYCHL